MSERRNFLLLVFIFLAGLLLRMIFPLHGLGFHPDERFIIMTAERLTLSDLNPGSFAYGSLPFYLLWLAKSFLGIFSRWLAEYDGLFLVGRTLSALFGGLCIIITYFLTRRVYGDARVSLLACMLVSFNVFHIQLSRFFAFDIILAALMLGAVYMFSFLERPYKLRFIVGSGIMLGLAVGTKVAALALLIPLLFALFLSDIRKGSYTKKTAAVSAIGCGLMCVSAYFLVDPSIFSPLLSSGLLAKVSLLGWIGLAVYGVTAIILLMLPQDLGGSERLQTFSQIAVIGFCTLLCVEPYAFFDYSTFVKHSHEQLSMVKGEWFAPYTWQYFGTVPYLYQLKQMFFYTMGAPTFIAVCAGVIYISLAQMRSRNNAERLILSLLLPFFLVVGAYQVKFPRYLIPLYPLCFILAARILMLTWDNAKRYRLSILAALLILIVAGSTVFRGLSLLSVYASDHTYTVASRWIFENAPTGSRILGPHWDDRLPISLPGEDTSRYNFEGRVNDLEFYEPENPQKLTKMAERLSRAEYVVFPTARMQGSVPRLASLAPHGLRPEPYTTTLLQMLYSGELGYKLVYTAKIEPHVGPFTYNDDLADESFSVYDHPKASVFEKIETLPAEAIIARVEQNVSKQHLPSMDDMLLGNSPQTSGDEKQPSTFWGVIRWYGLVLLLGILAFPLVSSLLPERPALVAGISKAFGLLMFSLLSWYLSYFFRMPLTGETLTTALLIVIAVLFAFLSAGNFKSLEPAVRQYGREVVTCEALFAAGFLIVLALRAFQPEIFWGEKPMDSTFFNYFSRLEHIPPQDPWAYGRPLQYYYLGSYIMGLLQKIAGTKAGVGYNVALAVIAGCHLTGLYGIIKTLSRRSFYAILGAFAIIFFSNLDAVYLAAFDKKTGFDLYWASSRTLHTPAINEYPFWAFLFGDLHAHLITLPFTLLPLSFALGIFLRDGSTFSAKLLPAKVALGFCLGALLVLNSWDFISYSTITGVFLAAYWIHSLAESWEMRRWRYTILLMFADVLIISIAAIVGGGPLLFEAAGSIRPSYGFVTGEEFNSGWEIFRVLGQFMPSVLASLILLVIVHKHSRKRPRLIVAALAAVLPISIALWSVLTPDVNILFSEIHWSIFLFCAGVMGLAGFALLPDRDVPTGRETRALLLIILTASVILCVVELHFLMDRANTIFKFYHGLWTLLGIASLSMIPTLVENAFGKFPFHIRSIALAGLCFAAGFLALAFTGSLVNLVHLMPFQRINGPRPTLDGDAFLSRIDGDESRLISWINKSVRDTPSMIEAVGSSYGDFTRIAMHTGVPVVMGWEYHVSQRGTSIREIKERFRDVDNVYISKDAATARDIARRWGASYVVVGNLERRKYHMFSSSLDKFDTSPAEFTKIFESGPVRLYSVNEPLDMSLNE